jgi:hypothetical protein
MKNTYLFSYPRLVFWKAAPQSKPGPVEGKNAAEKAKMKLWNFIDQLDTAFLLYPRQKIAIPKGNQRLLIQSSSKRKIRITWLSVKPGQKTYDKKEIYFFDSSTGSFDKFRSNYSKAKPAAKDVIARLSYFNPVLKQKVNNLRKKAEAKIIQDALKRAKRMRQADIKYLNPAERKKFVILKSKKNLTEEERMEFFNLMYKILKKRYLTEDWMVQDNSIKNRIKTYWILGKPW